MSPFEEVLCLPALWLSCMHPRARLNWDCIIGKAPPFLLLLTSGDIDLPKSVLAVRRAGCVMSLLASSLTSPNAPTKWGRRCRCEKFQGLPQWSHLTICTIPDNFWCMCLIEAGSSPLGL